MATQLRVLLVEDSGDCASTTATLLRLYGHDVAIANNGIDALGKVNAYNPHVVALDLGLPDMDGLAVARSIKEQATGKSPIMIAITGHGTPEHRRMSAEAGIAIHLVKPVDPRELEAIFQGLKEAAV